MLLLSVFSNCLCCCCFFLEFSPLDRDGDGSSKRPLAFCNGLAQGSLQRKGCLLQGIGVGMCFCSVGFLSSFALVV